LYAVFSFAIRATCLTTSPALISSPREHLVRSADYETAHYIITVSSLSIPPSVASHIAHPRSMSFPGRDHSNTNSTQNRRLYALICKFLDSKREGAIFWTERWLFSVCAWQQDTGPTQQMWH
jgi:hypothetical protein